MIYNNPDGTPNIGIVGADKVNWGTPSRSHGGRFDFDNTGLAASGQNPINYPSLHTMENSLEGINKLLPNGGVYEPIAGLDASSYAPIQGLDTKQFGSIPGLDDSYYQSLLDSSTKALRNQYFEGDNSLAAQNELTATKRGILGTGVEQGGINELNKDFGSKLADVTGTISRTRAENDVQRAIEDQKNQIDLAKYNTDVDIGNRDFGFGVDKLNTQTAFDNQTGLYDMTELGLSAAGDDAINRTNFGLGKFEQEVNLEEILSKGGTDTLERAIEFINSPMVSGANKTNITEDVIAQIMASMEAR